MRPRPSLASCLTLSLLLLVFHHCAPSTRVGEVSTPGGGGQGGDASTGQAEASTSERTVGTTGPWLLSGARALSGEALSFGVSGKHIVPSSELSAEAEVLELGQRFVVPAFIDSHVHLAYYDVDDQLKAGGIVAAVDFAQPLDSLKLPFALDTRRAGPMLTPPGGYPTQSWGSAGFGLEVATPAEAQAQVDLLLDAGADFIKAALLGDRGLIDEALGAVAERAHERGVKVAVHALGESDATRALASEADILAHTPTAALEPEALQAWSGKAVVSTLSAFGAGQAALDNLRALADAGARVLYGTDLGNSRQVGIQEAELSALLNAGFSIEQIVAAATADAAEFWGFAELGQLTPNQRASFLVLEDDPNADPLTLARPRAVVIDGVLVAGTFP